MKKTLNRISSLLLTAAILLTPAFSKAEDSSRYSNQSIKIVKISENTKCFNITTGSEDIEVSYIEDGDTTLSFNEKGFSLEEQDGILKLEENESDSSTNSISIVNGGNSVSIAGSNNGIIIINGETIYSDNSSIESNESVKLVISKDEPLDFSLKTMSGNIIIDGLPIIDTVDIETMSGNTSFSGVGSINEFYGDTMSGNIYMNGIEPSKVYVKTLSGSVIR